MTRIGPESASPGYRDVRDFDASSQSDRGGSFPIGQSDAIPADLHRPARRTSRREMRSRPSQASSPSEISCFDPNEWRIIVVRAWIFR